MYNLISYIPELEQFDLLQCQLESYLNKFFKEEEQELSSENYTICRNVGKFKDYSIYFGKSAVFIMFIDHDHEYWIEIIRVLRLKADSALSPFIIFTEKKDEEFEKKLFRVGIAQTYSFNEFTYENFVTNLNKALNRLKFVTNYADKKNRQNDYLSIVSHDLKTPLGIIYSYMEILLRNDYIKDGPGEIKRKLQRAMENSEISLKIVTSILDKARFNQRQKLNFDFININDVIASVIEDLELSTRPKNLQITLAARQDYTVYADHRSMVQLFNNLLSNAIKFSPVNSEVTVTITVLKRGPINIKNSELIQISIEDRGSGIPQNQLKTIFAPFKQVRPLHDSKQGTGLGLNICQKICTYHHGNITVKSKIGEGSTFVILLPYIKRLDKKLSRRSLKILIIENYKPALNEIVEKLEGENFRPDGVESAGDAYERLKDNFYHAILLSLDLEDQDCLQFIQTVRQNSDYEHVPIFILSPLIHETKFYAAIEVADGYIQKPFSAKEFIIKLGSMLIKESSGAQEIEEKEKSESKEEVRTLFVDDSIDNQEIMSYFFNELGMQLDSVDSGLDCLETIKTKDYDLILMDIDMPVLDGYETTRKIRQWELPAPNQHLHIFACSANSTSVDKDRAISAGCDGFLVKPINIQKLKTLFQQVRENL